MAFFLGKHPLHNVTVDRSIPVAPPPTWLPESLQTPPKRYILSGVRAELPDGQPFERTYVQACRRGDDWYLAN